ncbi:MULTISPECIES: hypothetical protein [Klebsiella]|nr:hypothetical protein [Klebsiella sp. K4-154]
MSKKQTLSNTNYSSPDWLTIREAVEVINKKGLEIKKKGYLQACITWQHSSLYLLSVANYITKNTEIELQSKAQTM